MTTFADKDTAPSHRWLRLFLVLVAALEFLDAVSGVQNVFTDYHHDTKLLRFAQALTSINLALAPLLAGAALIFAALGNIRYAILALAAMTLATWVLDSLPSLAHARARLWHARGAFSLRLRSCGRSGGSTAGAEEHAACPGHPAGRPAALAKWMGFVAFFIAIMIYGF